MVFPATALPVRNQLFIDGQWVDFADATLIRDPIMIRRGIPDEGVRPDPSRCTSSLKNQSGDLSPRNPMGQYYGLFGRNTPQRIVIDEASDDFDRTASNGWGTSSSGHTWATSGGLASAYAVSGGNATVAISAVNSARITALDVSLFDCDVVATFKPGAVAAGAPIQMELVLRYQDADNMYRVGLAFNTDSTVQAFIADRKGGTNTTLATTSDLGTYDAASQWRIRAKICGRVITVRAWDVVDGTEPSTFDTWAVDNDADAILTAGDVGCRMILNTGNTNTLSVTVTTTDLEVVHHRFNGEVPVWPVDWDLSGNDVWAPITAAGLLRRVNKAKEALSPLRRILQGSVQLFGGAVASLYAELGVRRPLAYWHFEEDTGSTVASSGIPGVEPMSISGTVAWAAVDSVDGSAPLPDMMDGSGALTGSVPAQETLTGAWTVAAILTPPTLSSTWTPLSWTVADNTLYDRFELRITTGGNFELYAFAAGASTLLGSTSILDLATLPTAVLVQGVEFDGDTDYIVSTTTGGYDSELNITVETAVGTSPGYVTGVTVNSVTGGASDTAGLGHVTVWDGWFPLVLGTHIISAVQAHAGDQVHNRLVRLFEQDDIPFMYIGEESELIGKQHVARLPDLIDDCLVVDKGLLYEARDENAIIYLTRSARYNQAATLALTYGTSGHVAKGFRPIEDDRDIVNDLTIVREGGASGRFEQTTGPLSVSAPPDGVHRNPQKKTLPLHADTQPYPHAAWEVHLATWDEARWPSVNVNMARSARDATTIYQQAKRLDVGGRLTVDNVPQWVAPDVDLIALGLTEQIGGGPRIGAHAWVISAQTVPAGPWRVFQIEDQVFGRLATSGSSVALGIDSDDTSVLVATDPGKALWITTAGRPQDFDFAAYIGGELVTVTAISGTTSPQTFTVTRSVNGVTRSWAAGTPVQIATVAVPP